MSVLFADELKVYKKEFDNFFMNEGNQKNVKTIFEKFYKSDNCPERLVFQIPNTEIFDKYMEDVEKYSKQMGLSYSFGYLAFNINLNPEEFDVQIYNVDLNFNFNENKQNENKINEVNKVSIKPDYKSYFRKVIQCGNNNDFFETRTNMNCLLESVSKQRKIKVFFSGNMNLFEEGDIEKIKKSIKSQNNPYLYLVVNFFN